MMLRCVALWLENGARGMALVCVLEDDDTLEFASDAEIGLE